MIGEVAAPLVSGGNQLQGIRAEVWVSPPPLPKGSPSGPLSVQEDSSFAPGGPGLQ